MAGEDEISCGDWRLGPEIGRGAYGVVHLATKENGERSAVKVCRREDVGDERYERELRGAVLFMSIPPQEGLVFMSELIETEWGFYAVMDLADDEFGREISVETPYRPKTLSSVIAGEKALPLGECVKLGIALAKGLAALQRHHLLHRDIKPCNVIYVGGCPVISDPGLIVEESEAVSQVGTPAYNPPEGFTDAASDIYSLGLTLKAASFGRQIEDLGKGPAMEADTGAALFPAWWRILNKATDPTPSRRYQSAKALLKDIKMLRLKMAVMSKLGSRTAKVAIIAAMIAAAVCVAVPVAGIMDFNYQVQLSKYIEDASAWLQAAFRASANAYTVSRRLGKELGRKIKETSDGGEAEKLYKIHAELSDLTEKLREISVQICMSLIEHNESCGEEVGPSRRDVKKRLRVVEKLLYEGDAFQKQTWKIGAIIHGKEWEPPSQPLDMTPDGSMDALSINHDAANRIKKAKK